MKVKTYQTRSIQEAVEHIKREFGPDALILGTRTVTTRRPWGFKREQWEVTAGIDEDAGTPPTRSSVENAAATVHDSVALTDRGQNEGNRPGPANAAFTRRDASGEAMSEFEAPSRLIRKAESRIEEVLEEIDELKRAVRLFGQAMPRGGQNGGVYAELVGQGVDPEFAEDLIRKAAQFNGEPVQTREAVRGLLAGMFSIEPPDEFTSKERVISAFVGSTGVGKTTMIAKIGGLASAREEKKVALVSADSYRVSGQEQLSRYGQLLGIPTFLCSDPNALADVIGSLDDYDLVLIDTPGCSPSDLARIGKLENSLKSVDARIRLVLSATTKSEDVSRIYKRFQRLTPHSVALTKLDETETKGAMAAELLRSLPPVSYLSEGQHVPEDLLLPKGADLARLILPTGVNG